MESRTEHPAEDYRFVGDLRALVDIPQDGILSRTVHRAGALKTVLFGFSAAQELSEHTAAVPAVLQVLEGEVELVLGGKAHAAGAGTWAFMPAGLPHSLRAVTDAIVLLLLLPGAQEP